MKKFLTLLVCMALIVSIVLSAGNLGAAFASLEFPKFSDFFTKAEEFCTLTLQVGEGGRVEGAQPQYKKGEMVTLLAVPEEGQVFSGWFRGQSTYLTTAKSYSFVIEEDTALSANFAEKPEKMEGESISYGELFDCAEDFSFSIYCDRENAQTYLQENLKLVDNDLVGTQWEEHGKIDFNVTEGAEEGEYVITPAEGTVYEAGATYVATLPKEEGGEDSGTGGEQPSQSTGSFLDPENEENTLNFTIQQENKEEITYQDGIMYLPDCEDSTLDRIAQIVDDGLAAGEEGDVADYIVVYGDIALAAGDIFCVYGGTMTDGEPELDENSFFGKVISCESTEGNTRVWYDLPELEEIFEELDIYHSGDVDLEDADVEITEETIEQIRHQLMCNANFQDYVATAQQVVINQYGQDYDVQLLSSKNLADMIDIKIMPWIKGNTVTLNIEVALNIWIYRHGTKEKVAQFAFRMAFEKELELSVKAKIELRKKWGFLPVGLKSYDLGIGMVDRERLELGVKISYDTGTDGFATLDKDAAEETFVREFFELLNGNKPMFMTIKDTFEKNGYKAESDLRVHLFSMQARASIVTFNFDVALFLRFDIAVNCHYTTASEERISAGIRSSSKGPEPYKNVSNSLSASETVLAGKAEMRTGLRLDVYASFVGLKKYMRAGFAAEAGVYTTIAGCISFGSGYYAGYMEAGAFWRITVNYKLFSISGERDLGGKDYALFSMGYSHALMYYAEQDSLDDDKTNDIAIPLQKDGGTVNLLDYSLLKVGVLDADGGKISIQKLEHDNATYKVHVTTGKYLKYDSKTGKLSVKADAPLYFEEDIEIKVEANEKRWTWLKNDKYNSFLPTVTVTIVYGDEDAYYNSMDSKMEKEFRVLYREYNAQNAAFLQSNFKQMMSQIQVPNELRAIVDSLINRYIENLFDTIGEYRQQEQPGSRELENRFVTQEAGAFELTMTVFGRISESKEFSREEALPWIDQLITSRAMHKTLVEFADSGDAQILTDRFATANQQTKDEVETALQEYEASHAEDAAAMQVVSAVRKILGL